MDVTGLLHGRTFAREHVVRSSLLRCGRSQLRDKVADTVFDADPTAEPNETRCAAQVLWVFGYGSLIFRPDFPFMEKREGYIEGWSRRFWQASIDHRGTPELPGRVVTLIANAGERCWGVAYRVADADASAVLARLDHRERGGYQRRTLAFHPQHPTALTFPVVVYVADEANPHYVGPEDVARSAARVHIAHGPSGANRDYVLQLAAALLAMGADDLHVFELARVLASCPAR
jgi:cation transport protein ChaC